MSGFMVDDIVLLSFRRKVGVHAHMGRSLRDKSLISCFIDYILTQIRLHCGICTLMYDTNKTSEKTSVGSINKLYIL